MCRNRVLIGMFFVLLPLVVSLAQPAQVGEFRATQASGPLLVQQSAQDILADIDWNEVISELDAGFEQEPPLTLDPADVLWYFKAGNWIACKPLVDADGSVYFGSGDGNFYALDSSGNETWRYNVGAPIVADPTFDNQDRIIFGALDGALYCLNKDGTFVFSYWTEGPIFSTASVDLEGNIYFGSDDFYVYKLDSSGEILGRFKTGGWVDSRPTFLSDGRLSFSSYDGVVYVVDQGLNELARYETDTWLTRAFSVGNDDTIYAGGMDGVLYAVDPSGALKWEFDTGRAIFSSPVVVDTGVFFGSNGGVFYSVDVVSGNQRWRYSISSIEIISSPPALGPDSAVYFGVSNHKVYGLSLASEPPWSFDTGVEIDGTALTGKPILGGITMTDDGVAYFGNCGGVLFAVDTNMRRTSFPDRHSLDACAFGASPARLERLTDSPVHFDGVEMKRGRRLPSAEPNAVDMALKTMCMSRKSLDRPTEGYYGPYPYIEKCVLSITEEVLDDAFAGPPFAKELTDQIMFADQELQEYVLTAASPLGPTVLPANYDHFLSDTPLQDAIVQIYSRNHETLSPSQRDELAAQAGHLSLELRKAMAMVLFAMNDASARLDSAFAGVTPNMRSQIYTNVLNAYALCYYNGSFLSGVFDEWLDHVDFEQLLNAGATLLSGVRRAEDFFGSVYDSSTEPILFRFDTPIGFVMVGGAGENLFDSTTNGVRERNALLVDIGGNDVYYGRTAGAAGDDTPISVSIDLSGDDTYESASDGCQGWGLFGIGVLIDAFGDDTYIAQNHCQGASTFGIGVLQDMYGDDIFLGKEMSQGAAACGIGLLSNESGNDIYFSPEYSQGFGFTFGSGVLRDREGDDYYFIGGTDVDFREGTAGQERYVCMGQGFGFGPRRDEEGWQGAGGIGILTDGAGNDYYLGDYFAQGSSYWFSTGILDDKAGDDVYVARRYSIGAGIHNSVGILVDEAGNDEYWSWIVGIGHGLDASVGIVVDVMGDDYYSAKGWYAMGHGGDGVGVLLDNAGNDLYSQIDVACLGYAGPYDRGLRRPLGIFIDADGEDAYTTKGNNRCWVADETGVGIDMSGGDTGCLMP
ncbi:MAG TPA: PQQ-binding-like beta-propeller repeat protein [bacterium]|nr:PQQ-binding-like beta-propeller repeat protein [bacterium]